MGSCIMDEALDKRDSVVYYAFGLEDCNWVCGGIRLM